MNKVYLPGRANDCDRIVCRPPARKRYNPTTKNCECSSEAGGGGVERVTTPRDVNQYFNLNGLRASSAEIVDDPTTFLPEGSTVDSSGNVIVGGQIVGKVQPLREESQASLDFNAYNIVGAGVGAYAGNALGGMIGMIAGAIGGFFIGNMVKGDN